MIGTDEGSIVTDFVDISQEEAEKLHLSAWKTLHTAETLRRCPWCGSDRVGGCECQMKHDCPEPGDYRYPCLFCKNLRSASGGRRGGARDLASMRFSVTSAQYDDIGDVLASMQLTAVPFTKAGFDCDILFLNCGSGDAVDPTALRKFVEGGGCVYASDFAMDVLKAAFPVCASYEKKGQSGKCMAAIQDEEIRGVVGGTIEINFDMSAWVVISQPVGEVLITTAQYPAIPLMFTFTQGEGRVFYTSFHNHAQASDAERALLQVMLARQIGTVAEMSTEEVLQNLGVRINLLR